MRRLVVKTLLSDIIKLFCDESNFFFRDNFFKVRSFVLEAFSPGLPLKKRCSKLQRVEETMSPIAQTSDAVAAPYAAHRNREMPVR